MKPSPFHPSLPIHEDERKLFTYSEAAGARGERTEFWQELLNLRGYHCAIDGDAGPVTTRLTKQFQQRNDLPQTGRLDAATFALLIKPYVDAFRVPLVQDGDHARHVVVETARRHVGAEEISPNKGPWVRLYMAGNDGAPWAWCAGFNTMVWIQAGIGISKAGGNGSMPFNRTFSCDTLATRAKQAGLFIEGADVAAGRAIIQAGDLFLIQKSSADWIHTGVVTAVHGDKTFATVEGNTNQAGGREGKYVMARTRGIPSTKNSGVDFIRCPFTL